MAAAVRGAKQRLRAELKQRLRALSAEERRRQSHLLTQKVLAHPQYQRARRVSIFLSMPDEVDTAAIVHDIFQQGKVCFIPRYQRGSSHMDMVQLASPDELAVLPRTSWNILQPGEEEVREEALSTGGLDLIFMPGLGFDTQGRRLGRGQMAAWTSSHLPPTHWLWPFASSCVPASLWMRVTCRWTRCCMTRTLRLQPAKLSRWMYLLQPPATPGSPPVWLPHSAQVCPAVDTGLEQCQPLG